jgi:hypothetical protein
MRTLLFFERIVMRAIVKDEPAKELRYRGELIHHGKDGMINLTDMWKSVGSPANKDPRQWHRLPTTKDLLDYVGANVGKSHIWRSSKGNAGGTWAAPSIAIAYASYLSMEFYVWAQNAIVSRVQRMAVDSQSTQREKEIAKWVSRGKSLAWATRRVDGKGIRHKFTDALKDHGITEPWQYGQVTNEIYKGVLGRDKNGILFERQLPPKANLRDHLETIENAAVSLTEAMAENDISACDLNGVRECREACKASSEAVRISLEKNRDFIANYRKKLS